MISVIELLAGLVKTRNGKIIGLLLFAGTILFFIWNIYNRNSRISKVPVISLLESVKRMERLELLTYHTEEVLTLGDPDVLQKLIDQTSKDSLKTFKQLSDSRMSLEQNQIAQQTITFNRHLLENDIRKKEKTTDSLRQRYELMEKRFTQFKKEIEDLSSDTVLARYGQSLQIAWQSLRTAKSEEQNAKSHQLRKSASGHLKNAENNLQKLWLTERKQRYDAWEVSHQSLIHLTKDATHATHNRKLKHLEEQAAKIEKEIDEQQLTLAKDSARLAELRSDLNEADYSISQSLERKNQRLLAILPTRASLYLDLQTEDFKL